MKTIFTLMAFLCLVVPSFAQLCEINQPESNAFANVSTETAAGQSFKACGSGIITNIKINIGNLNTTSLRLQVATGPNTLSPEYTQDFNVSENGDVDIPLTTPFPVQDQQVYAFTIIGVTGANTLATLNGFNGNPYLDGNTIVETGGNATDFGADTRFAITLEEGLCVINQPESNAFANISTETAAGQSFKACGSGIITNIKINIGNLNTTSLRLQVATGPNTLTPEYTQDFNVSANGDVDIPLTTPFPVQDQQVYAFTIIGITGANTLAILNGFNGNPYLDGNTIVESGGNSTDFGADTRFAITIEEGLCVLNQPESNAFANISTETAAGQSFKACGSGIITNIKINIGNLNTTSLRLQVATGPNTLSPEYTQDFNVSENGDVDIPLTTPFPVQDQQVYAFTIIGVTGANTLAILNGFNGNPYLDGNTIVESGGNSTDFGADTRFAITFGEGLPPNDLACLAIAIPANGVVQTGYTNTNATAFNSEEAIAPAGDNCTTSWCPNEIDGAITSQVNNSVWFTFVAPATGAVEVSTCGLASFNSQLAVYTATDCNDFSSYTLVGANDDGPASCATDLDSWVSLNGLTVGATYYVMVDGFKGATGDFDISVTEVVFTSTEETVLETSDVKIFPNPNKGAFSVNLDGIADNTEMIITNITGQTVYRQMVTANTSNIEVQLREVPHGLYLVSLVNEDQRIVRKVVIE